MRVLTVNVGSSSLKVRLLDRDDQVERSADLPMSAAGIDACTLADTVALWPVPQAVAHRIVHGGPGLTGPVRWDPAVRRDLEALTDLAPLHQPRALAAADIVTNALPDVPAIACLDTVFHRTIPAAAATYAVPATWRSAWPIQRFGFHGLSHADASAAGARLVDRDPGGLRTVVCHLGAGASLCAVRHGRSIDTTMGFTPLDGLVMATRAGSLDPGLLLWLLQHTRLTPGEMSDALEHRSGMLGLTGTADMRSVLERAAAGDEDAVLGLEIYVHHLVAGIAAMTASLGGLDLLVFTGGVGEGASEVRLRAAMSLAHLGVAVDQEKNSRGADLDISAAGAGASTVVVQAREDRQMAKETRDLLHAV